MLDMESDWNRCPRLYSRDTTITSYINSLFIESFTHKVSYNLD